MENGGNREAERAGRTERTLRTWRKERTEGAKKTGKIWENREH